jgi:hypothetical protein
MDTEHIVQQIFDAKWICNGFPKSGTHLLVQMVHPVAPFQTGTEAGLFDKPWAGTFNGNSWTEDWTPLEHTCYKLGRVGNGRMVKAHLGHTPELAEWMRLAGLVHIFIYRDLRDVAVSQAHHIIHAGEERFAHPDPSAYPLEDFDAVLALVIAGHKQFPGVVRRWSYYAPWLDVGWTLSVRFEDLRYEPEEWAERIFTYGMLRNAEVWDKTVTFDPDGLDAVVRVMSKAGQQRERSATFRKGEAGGWREAFTEEHKRLWIANDPDRWLVKLGYEEDGWYG